jgi:hypothetical protein
LMLRHRFREKIRMDTPYSLENFIEEILGQLESTPQTPNNTPTPQ